MGWYRLPWKNRYKVYLNAKNYLKLISEEIERCATEISGNGSIFQQDNAVVHTAKVTKLRFEANNISLLEWPATNVTENPQILQEPRENSSVTLN